MMNILVQCFIISSLLILLLTLRLFQKRWKNIIVYTLFSTLIVALVLIICQKWLGFVYSKFLLIPYLFFLYISFFVYKNKIVSAKKKDEDCFVLYAEEKKIEFYYPRDNFLVFGGAGSGKTASIGKPLLEQFIKYNWAGFIYDYKDYDYTQTAYNLINKYKYPYKFYYISFTDMSRTYRFNPLKKEVIGDENLLAQVLDDFLKAMLPMDAKTDEWYSGGLGILIGVAIRFFHFAGEYTKYCTLPHILHFILLADRNQLMTFLEEDMMAKMAAAAFITAKDSERTASSYLSTLCNNLTKIAINKNICHVLTGDDFIFNLVDPEDPKLFAVSNNFNLESIISPVVAMLLPISTRKIKFGNSIKFAYILDEMTTFKVNNFQNLPSVLREYNVAFLIMTQSGSKLEKAYGKNDRASIEANCANLFIGRTKDVEALKYYPLFFGKEEIRKESFSSGNSSGRSNSSVTRSTQKEEVYDTNIFAQLGQGEFILSAGQANLKRIKAKYKKFELQEEPLPIVKLTTNDEVEESYDQLQRDVEMLIEMLCGKN